MIELIKYLAGAWEMATAVLDESGLLKKIIEGGVPEGVKGVQARDMAVAVALRQMLRALSGLRKSFEE